MHVRFLKNPCRLWTTAVQEGRAVSVPLGYYGKKEPPNAEKIRQKLQHLNLEVDEYSFAEVVVNQLNRSITDWEGKKRFIEIPCDNEVDYMLQLDGKVMVYFSGADEYHGHGESDFWFGVQGIIPNDANEEEIDRAIRWLEQLFEY